MSCVFSFGKENAQQGEQKKMNLNLISQNITYPLTCKLLCLKDINLKVL